MNIQTAIKQRLEEHELSANIRELRTKLAQAEQVARETIARRAIVEWIESAYHISLDDVTVRVNEQRTAITDNITNAWYGVDISFGPDCHVSVTRKLVVDDDRLVVIEPHHGDKPEAGQYINLWNASRNGYYVKYDNLIDALIYAADYNDLTNAEIAALFPATAKVEG